MAGALAYFAKSSRLAQFELALVCVLSTTFSPDSFTFLSIATAVGLYLAFRGNYIYTGLDWRWLQFLGGISYSLYLVHNPVVGAISYLSARWIASDVATLTLSLVASIAVATLFWLLFERPSLSLAKHVQLIQTARSETPQAT